MVGAVVERGYDQYSSETTITSDFSELNSTQVNQTNTTTMSPVADQNFDHIKLGMAMSVTFVAGVIQVCRHSGDDNVMEIIEPMHA